MSLNTLHATYLQQSLEDVITRVILVRLRMFWEMRIFNITEDADPLRCPATEVCVYYVQIWLVIIMIRTRALSITPDTSSQNIEIVGNWVLSQCCITIFDGHLLVHTCLNENRRCIKTVCFQLDGLHSSEDNNDKWNKCCEGKAPTTPKHIFTNYAMAYLINKND